MSLFGNIVILGANTYLILVGCMFYSLSFVALSFSWENVVTVCCLVGKGNSSMLIVVFSMGSRQNVFLCIGN